MMEHLVAVQYTVTCTMLAAAAAFWFLTSKPQKEPVKFIRSNIPAILPRISGVSDPIGNASFSTSDDLCRRGCEVEL